MGQQARPVVLEDVVMVVGEDGEGVTQHEARPHHHVPRPLAEAGFQPLGDQDQRDLRHHPEKSPGLKIIKTSVAMETGHSEKRTKDLTLNILRGTLSRYSWRTADTENTANTANCFEKPLLRRGLYRCLEHHLKYIGGLRKALGEEYNFLLTCVQEGSNFAKTLPS